MYACNVFYRCSLKVGCIHYRFLLTGPLIRTIHTPYHLITKPVFLTQLTPHPLYLFAPLCLTARSPTLPISAGTGHAAVPSLRLPLGHGGAAGAGGRDAPGAGSPLRTVPVPLPVHQRALAVQTARQVQVLQFCALGDGI